MKPKHQRLIFVVVSIVFLFVSSLLALRAFDEHLIYFYSPTMLAETPPALGQKIRIGGLVGMDSVKRGENDNINFKVNDGKSSISVNYQGMVPSLFREGQGVVAEGMMTDATHFQASMILAKHDENYMPKEVVDALKKTGHWQHNYAR